MIKRELHINQKSFMLWTGILIGMFLVVYLIYPFIITDETVKTLDEMLKVFPEEILKAFNMDIASINSAYGWLKSEGFMYVLIVVGIYSANLGFNILLKEEYDKTIEYLSFVPITRSKILTNKIIVSSFYIFLMIVALGVFNYLALLLSGSFNQQEYLLLSITPLLIAYPFFAINLYLSTLVKHPKKSFGISLGMVFVFYIINILSELSDKVSFLKYFSLYTLADIRGILTNGQINPLCIIISIVITIFFTVLAYISYNEKEFYG